jgi:hypothetical protein
MRIHTFGSKPLIQAAALAVLVSTAALAADLTQTARDLFGKQQNSLVTVSALNKMDMGSTGMPIRLGGLGDAQENSCNGLVLDGSGLTVVSYAALNPMEKAASAIKLQMGEDSEDNALKFKSELSRIQMRLADGTEVPARLVFKDKDLDLAFIVPEPKSGDKAPAFTAVSLASDVTAKELDDIIVMSRHNKSLGYQATLDLGRITGVISKPRTMYDLSGGVRPGAVVFLPDGRLLGVVVTAGSEGGGFMSMEMEQLVLPAAEIIKLADQAKKAAAKKDDSGEKKKEQPAADKSEKGAK